MQECRIVSQRWFLAARGPIINLFASASANLHPSPCGPWNSQRQFGSESEFDHPDFPQCIFPGGPRGPWGGGTRAPLTVYSDDEWLRIATHRAFTPHPRIVLYYSKLVTFYHPRLTSLAPGRARNRSDITMRIGHLLTDFRDGYAVSVAAELPAGRRAVAG